ncbi:MAG: hypothetical protein KF819_11285 [Labilithrix sp.]|nr:hypothetical protein [Labilithrix sp.]
MRASAIVVWVSVAAVTSACDKKQEEEGAGAGCVGDCPGGAGGPGVGPTATDAPPSGPPPRSDDGIQNGAETDVDCGGPSAPKCAEGKKCVADRDCNGACQYTGKCIATPSCKPHLGGDTCGPDEVGMPGANHESCCKTLPVAGFVDARHPDKTVYLDKYEITTGRVRAFLTAISAQYGGTPNIEDWVAKNPPAIWDASWNKFLPADADGKTIVVDRQLLGDPRGTWPGAPPVPATDEFRKTGTDFQFNGNLFVYLHGNNCSTHAPGAFGFPTFFYPAAVLAKMGPDFPPRADGIGPAGNTIPAREHLEVKSMNCITNALLQAFCHWDGGQLATSEVLDFVTDSPPELGNLPGCGAQIGDEDPPTSAASKTGGRCADLAAINAIYDAGATLPEPGSPLNAINYEFPYFLDSVTHDKAWEVAAPGRRTVHATGEAVDQVRIHAGDEPWMDLAGNLSEAVLTTQGGAFSGKFGLKFRGIGYQSSRSQLNSDPSWDQRGIARLERAEAKGAFAGGRCMRFK